LAVFFFAMQITSLSSFVPIKHRNRGRESRETGFTIVMLL
jgi:hypothetical protein